MGTCSEKNGKTSLLYLLARWIVNPLGHLAPVVCLGALGAGAYWSARLAWADYLFRMDTESSVRRAARLEPANAEYHARLATLLENTNDAVAERELRQAIAGNPRLSSAWIELGLRAENAGDASRAEKHLVRAAEVDRMYTAQWTLANFYFRHNQGDRFWPVARRALSVGDVGAYDPPPLFRLCWKLSRDPSTILERAIPDVGGVEARYLEFLVRENQVPAAEQVTERVVALSGDYELGPVFEYCDRLILAGDAGRAIHAWNTLCRRALPGYRPLAPEAGVSLTNGDFAQSPVGRGFDWRMPQADGIAVERGGVPPRIRITLDGHEPERCDLLEQILAVEPARRYRLRFRYQTDGIATQSGLRWRVSDVARREEMASDAADLASEQEAEARVRFRVPAGVRLARLTLGYRRGPGAERLEGRVAVAGVSLELDP